jgi:hypothetical protein
VHQGGGNPSDPAWQLLEEFADQADRHMVSDTLAVARHDLSGQISSEALDEMAYRLAHHRLQARVSS